MHPFAPALLATLFGLTLPFAAGAAGSYEFVTDSDGAGNFSAKLWSESRKDEEALDLYSSFDLWARGVTIEGRRHKMREIPSPDPGNIAIACYKPNFRPNRETFCSFRFRDSPFVRVDVKGRVLMARTVGEPAHAIFRKLFKNTPRGEFDWISKDGKMRWHSTPDAFDFFASDPR